MAEGHRILLLHRDVKELEQLRGELAGVGYRIFMATSVAEAATILSANATDLVVFDASATPDDGLGFVGYVCENHSDTAVIVAAGQPSIDDSVAAIRLGADDYLTKPIPSERLLESARKALRRVDLRKLLRAIPESDRRALKWGIIGDSPPMLKLYAQIPQFGASDAPVLIHGETGTGKELVARALHSESPRSSAPFLTINCAAVAPTLLESELFGHEKGAFTGADRGRKGVFRAADRGSLFLDEIGEMASDMQSKILRVLEDGLVRPLGMTRVYPVDVRVIAATHRDLERLVSKKRFREDLLYRINVLPIEIPPLRERGEDILLLARYFLRDHLQNGRVSSFTDDAIQKLLTYPWPGNVRELANVMRRLAILSEGKEIAVAALPKKMRSRLTTGGTNLRHTLADVENQHIRRVYAALGRNQTRTAASLKISREKLRRRLHALDLIG